MARTHMSGGLKGGDIRGVRGCNNDGRDCEATGLPFCVSSTLPTIELLLLKMRVCRGGICFNWPGR